MSLENQTLKTESEEVPQKRETIREKVKHIKIDQGNGIILYKNDPDLLIRDKITYTDVLDNITEVERDLKYVTGKANVAELNQRLRDLEDLKEIHPAQKIIDREHDENFERKMSFNWEQRDAISNMLNDMPHIPTLNIRAMADKVKEQSARDNDGNDLNYKKAVDDFVLRCENADKSSLTEEDLNKAEELISNYKKVFI